MCDFLGDQAQDTESWKAIVFFNTADDIKLVTCSSNGRKFGMSVIAPFSKVTLDNNNDFIDGMVVAKTFVNNNSASQIHGNLFTGSFTCTQTITPSQVDSCQSNLMDGVSASSGPSAYASSYPLIQSCSNPLGRDNSVAFFVGGNYRSVKAAEIEGKIVVMGNFTIESNGVNSLVQAGVGSCIIPSDGTDIMLVGGGLTVNRPYVSVMETGSVQGGNVLVAGSKTGSGTFGQWKGGSMKVNSNIDFSNYNTILTELKTRSIYWSKLATNGIFIKGSNYFEFKAGNTDCLQVFHVLSNDINPTNYGFNVNFNSNLSGKTILINIQSNNGVATMGNLANFFDTNNKGGFQFSSDLKASILWNFYDSTNVKLGAYTSGVGEFPGSILIPIGNLEMTMPDTVVVSLSEGA
jgi:choice-of-anchor A domain-containing protein